MKSQNTKSSDELQKEVRKELRNVRKDIDELQGWVTPGRFIDDAIFTRRGKSPAAIFDHLKRNPIGTAFLSLGTILLMEDEGQRSYESSTRAKLTDLKKGLMDQLPHKDLQEGMSPNKADLAKGKIKDFKNNLQSKVTDISSKVSQLKDKFPDKETNLGEETESDFELKNSSSKLKVARDKFKSTFDQGRDKISNLEPMTYMALGASLGAMTGAALPISETEQNFVSDKFQGAFNNFGDDLQNAVNECSNILKDLVMGDVKNLNVDLFK